MIKNAQFFCRDVYDLRGQTLCSLLSGFDHEEQQAQDKEALQLKNHQENSVKYTTKWTAIICAVGIVVGMALGGISCVYSVFNLSILEYLIGGALSGLAISFPMGLMSGFRYGCDTPKTELSERLHSKINRIANRLKDLSELDEQQHKKEISQLSICQSSFKRLSKLCDAQIGKS